MVFLLKNIGEKMVRYVAHEADYIRLEALLKFGSLISDFDVVVVNGTLSASIFYLNDKKRYCSLNSNFSLPQCLHNT